MHARIGIFSAVLLAAAALAAQARATEVQTTSYSAWLATVSGAPIEWNLVVPPEPIPTFNLADGASFTLSPAANERPASPTAASNKTSVPAPVAASADIAAAAMIGSGLLFFGARRKVFSNISASQTGSTTCSFLEEPYGKFPERARRRSPHSCSGIQIRSGDFNDAP